MTQDAATRHPILATLTPAQWAAAERLSETDRRHDPAWVGQSVADWLLGHGARPELCGQGCILIQAWGQLIGIEPDGYTHS